MSLKHSLWLIKVALTTVLFSNFAWSQQNTVTPNYVRLLNPYNMDLHALEINPTNSYADFYEGGSFAPGTRFTYLSRGGLLDYLYVQDGSVVGSPSLMPIVYLHPVGANGQVDTSVVLGMPANFLEFESSGTNVYEHPAIRSFFESCDLSNDNLCNTAVTPTRGYTSEVFQTNLTQTEENLTFISRFQVAAPSTEGAEVGPVAVSEGAAAVDESLTAPAPTPRLSGNVTPRLSFGDLSPEDSADEAATAPAATEGVVAAETSAVAPVVAAAGEVTDALAVAPVAPAVSAPLDPNNYNNDPVLRNMLEMRLTQRLANPLVRAYGGTNDTDVFRAEATLPANSRFILIPDEPRKKITGANGEVTYYRLVYGVTSSGVIASNSSGVRAQFYIPETSLEFFDPDTGTIQAVASDTNLIRIRPVEAVPAPTETAEEGATDVADTAAVDAETAAPATPTVAVPPVVAPPVEDPAPEVADSADDDAGPNITDLSLCSNQAFARQYSANASCTLIEVENFQMVKAQLLRNLNRNVLTDSLIVSVDATNKMCSHISLTEETYNDYSAQNENLRTNFDEIVQQFRSIPISERLGAAIQGPPTESQYTYSCQRDRSACRISYDHLLAESIPFNSEVTAPSTDPSRRQSIRVYGPDSLNRYLVQTIVGSQVQRAVVFEDKPGVVFNGNIGNILNGMEDYNDLREDGGAVETSGHFISSTTYDLDGQRVVERARLRTPEALSLIGRIRASTPLASSPNTPVANKKFYRLACNQAPTRPANGADSQPLNSNPAFGTQ